MNKVNQASQEIVVSPEPKPNTPPPDQGKRLEFEVKGKALKKNNLFLVGGLILLLVLAGLAGYWRYQKRVGRQIKLDKTLKLPQPTEAPVTPEPTEVGLDSALEDISNIEMELEAMDEEIIDEEIENIETELNSP